MLRILTKNTFQILNKIPYIFTSTLRNFVTLIPSQVPAKLPEKVPEKLMISREWAYAPFGRTPPPLRLPLYNIQTGLFTGQNVGNFLYFYHENRITLINF